MEVPGVGMTIGAVFRAAGFLRTTFFLVAFFAGFVVAFLAFFTFSTGFFPFAFLAAFFAFFFAMVQTD